MKSRNLTEKSVMSVMMQTAVLFDTILLFSSKSNFDGFRIKPKVFWVSHPTLFCSKSSGFVDGD